MQTEVIEPARFERMSVYTSAAALQQEEARIGNLLDVPCSAKPFLLAQHIDVRLSTEEQQRAEFGIIRVIWCFAAAV